MITGESLPVSRSVGDEVIGATLNKQGLIKMRTTRVGRDTALAQIIRLVEQAQGSQAPIQRLADRVAAGVVPGVIGISTATFFLWVLGGGTVSNSLLPTVAGVVIPRPCALGVATPRAIILGIGKT